MKNVLIYLQNELDENFKHIKMYQESDCEDLYQFICELKQQNKEIKSHIKTITKYLEIEKQYNYFSLWYEELFPCFHTFNYLENDVPDYDFLELYTKYNNRIYEKYDMNLYEILSNSVVELNKIINSINDFVILQDYVDIYTYYCEFIQYLDKKLK